MKKIIFLLPFLMLASLFSMGQNIKHVSLNFSMDFLRHSEMMQVILMYCQIISIIS